MADLNDILDRRLWDNSVLDLAIAAGVAALVFAAGLIARRLVRKHYQRVAATPDRELMELPLRVVSRTTTLFLIFVAAFAGLAALRMSDRFRGGVMTALTIAFSLQAGIWCTTAVVAWLERKRAETLEVDRAAVGSLGIIAFIAKVLIWALVLLLALDNLGVDITALVAGLGIGGIAVALALQNVLGDLFASLSIALDRPFVIGDFIVVGDFLGNVENIGIKSVRLRSLSGEQIVMSNADLLSSRVRNYGRMVERRVVFTVGVTYETPRKNLMRIPQIIRAIVEAQEGTRFDRSHFAKYGGFSLEFETVYYVLTPDYNRHMDVQQAIYFAIHEAFERDGIDFAYPTQKLWVANTEQQETNGRGQTTSDHAS